MRLLLITQKVDAADDALGFFYYWILEFSKHFEKVTVICLEEGSHDLPNNVFVFSLGKERFKIDGTRFKVFEKITYTVRFLRYVVRFRKEYDVVFVHMNPEYAVLAGFLWRLWRKKIGMWYVHRQVNLKLRIAEKLVHVIWSTTPEAFRLKSKKVHFLGHGINFSLFPRKLKSKLWTSDVHTVQIVHVGRITPIKNLDILIEAAAILKKTWDKKFRITLIGISSVFSDIVYEKNLRELIKKHGLQNEISFIGKVPFRDIARLYHNADISVNLTPTGGMDKAVLESITCGIIALSANKAFSKLFGEYKNYLLYNERDAEDTARKIVAIVDLDASLRQRIADVLYEKVKNNFSLGNLISDISNQLKNNGKS